MEKAVNLAETEKLQTTFRESPASHISNQQVSSTAPDKQTAKRYARVKIIVSITGSILFFALSVTLLMTGGTSVIEQKVRDLTANDYVVFLLFAAVLGLLESVLTFPLKYYSGYHLEHKYKLSNQTLVAWLWEGVKGMLVGIPIITSLLLAFYYCLKNFGAMWWLPIGTVLFIVSVVLARLAPVLIFPLFYKFKPLDEGELKNKILALCKKVGMSVQGVFVFDMSKNTKKANAAFTGVGKSKRIILGDTLVANFTDDEIETIFAHELGHYKLKHIWVMMIVGTVSSFLGLYLTAVLYQMSLSWFGFSKIEQIAALPLLGLWLGLYSLVTSPLSNMLSRAHERAADRFAIKTSNNKQAFINALRKLAVVNLADTAPHPLIEFLFHSHPSIEKRIRAIEQL
ncbi:MAG: M48 family metallopeptidase [Ignavibacteriales bacterium]|nr:M48 family metallopeptidase [Ignavibacteriales bacterium]